MEQELNSVIRRVYQIAKEHYNSDMSSNVLSIYNRLSDAEQTIFLQGVIKFLFEVETPPIAIAAVVEEQEEEFNIETFNQMELIKLKSWIVKCIAVMISFFMGITAIYMLVNAFVPTNHSTDFGDFIEFFKTLFGL